ncbi:MAG: BlaI/MecI/CopY family transcriptional regulator [Actinomycetota bacterium]
MGRIKGELGPLERWVMELFWADDGTELTVRDVLSARTDGDLAYTTLMTVVERLYRKGFLARRRAGRAYVYGVRVRRDDYLGGLVADILEGTDDRRGVLLGFVRQADTDDLAGLRAAIRAVERERRSGR